MSKMDDLRAMREARYEQMTARASKTVATPRKPAAPTPKPVESAPAVTKTEPAVEGLCGHRAISGRTCTREQGHAAKSHRYA